MSKVEILTQALEQVKADHAGNAFGKHHKDCIYCERIDKIIVSEPVEEEPVCPDEVAHLREEIANIGRRLEWHIKDATEAWDRAAELLDRAEAAERASELLYGSVINAAMQAQTVAKYHAEKYFDQEEDDQ